MAETMETRPLTMQSISLDTLCILLKYVLQRMKLPETKPFHQPVDCGAVPSYTDYVFHPMDFATIDRNIKKKLYGSPEAFVADFKWILHNCVVFNGKNHSLTTVAKTIVKMCCHEVNELLICPDCYLNSCVKDSEDWFCEPCRIPHTLVWAKMKGYPFWPAKVLREDDNGQVDVRFFGEHDRAWVSLNQVFVLSLNPPSLVPKKTKGFDEAKVELERHVQMLREKSHNFEYAPDKLPYESKKLPMSSSLPMSMTSDGSGSHGNIQDEVSCSSSSDAHLLSFFSQSVMNAFDVAKSSDNNNNININNNTRNNNNNNNRRKRKSGRLPLKRRISSRLTSSNNTNTTTNNNNNNNSNNNDDVVEKSSPDGDDIDGSIDISKDDRKSGCDEVSNASKSVIEDPNKYEKIVLKINKMHFLPKKSTTTVPTAIVDSNSPKITVGRELLHSDNNTFVNLCDCSNNNIVNDNNDDDNNNFESMSEYIDSSNPNPRPGPLDAEIDVMKTSANNSAAVNHDLCPPHDMTTTTTTMMSSDAMSSDKLECLLADDGVMGGDMQNKNAKSPLVSENTTTSHKKAEGHLNLTLDKIDIDLSKYQNKLLANVQDMLSEMVEDVIQKSPNLLKGMMEHEIENVKLCYLSELEAFRHTKDLQIAEMRLQHDYEKLKMEANRREEMMEMKSKRWCSYCSSEAEFNCCSVADYCGEACQEKHWSKHKNSCTSDSV